MSVSVVKSSSKTNVRHNNRELNRSEMRNNGHIDLSRSDKNIILVQREITEVYAEQFGEALKNYNDKQKRNDRKIENYYDHICKSKRHQPQQEIIFQIGENEDFNSQESREVALNILRETFEDFQARNPQLIIYNAVIHDDEETPHMHVNFVPVATDYQRGLDKQVSFDKSLLQQDPDLNVERPFADWRQNEVDLIEVRMNQFGIERKIVGTNQIPDVNMYKHLKDLNRDIESKREIVSNLETVGIDLKARNEQLLEETSLGQENAVKQLETLQKGVKPTLFNKDFVQIPKKDLENLENEVIKYAKANEQLSKSNRMLQEQFDSVGIDPTEVAKMRSRITALENNESTDSHVYGMLSSWIERNHDRFQSICDSLPIPSEAKNYLKGFITGVVQSKGLAHTKSIAFQSMMSSHKQALEHFGISEKSQNQEPKNEHTQKQTQSRSRGPRL